MRTGAQRSKSPAQVQLFAFSSQSVKARFELKSVWLQSFSPYRQGRVTSSWGGGVTLFPKMGPGMCLASPPSRSCSKPGAHSAWKPLKLRALGNVAGPAGLGGLKHVCVSPLHVAAATGLGQRGPVTAAEMSSHMYAQISSFIHSPKTSQAALMFLHTDIHFFCPPPQLRTGQLHNLWGPVQNKNAELLVQKLRILRQ